MIEKLKSRKFLVTLLTVICGIASLFGVADSTVEMIMSIGMIIIPGIVYVCVEGHIDAKAIVDMADDILEQIEGKSDKTEGE